MLLMWGKGRGAPRGGARGLTGWFAYASGAVELRFFQWSGMDVRVGLLRSLSAKELMLLNYGFGEDS